MATFFKTITSQPGYWHDTVHQYYSDFPLFRFLVLICVFVRMCAFDSTQFHHMDRFVVFTITVEIQNNPITSSPSHCPFTPTPPFLLPPRPLQSWQPLNFSLFIKFFISKCLCKWNHTKNIFWNLLFSHSAYFSGDSSHSCELYSLFSSIAY